MTQSELTLLASEPNLPFAINSVSERWGQLVINNKIAIPVEKYSTHFNTEADISIFDNTGNEVGLICFTREKGLITWRNLTENQFIAFLIESEFLIREDPYRFSKNYIVINESFYEQYSADYKNTAPFWGGFYHSSPEFITNSYTTTIREIHLRDVVVPPSIFIENSMRAVAQPYAFERFLKFYHLLELRFDFEVIQKIQNLDVAAESERIGELLSDYSSNEIVRLEDLLLEYCYDIPAIVSKLNLACRFPAESKEMFFRFGSTKKGNPFNGQEAKFDELILNGFDEQHLQQCGLNYQANFRKFIIKLVAFWIYRVRCSVAHSKIGEYMLTMGKENYLVEFAEPLLSEVIIQCFKR